MEQEKRPRIICDYNPGVRCVALEGDKVPCQTCGWNHAVEKTRKAENLMRELVREEDMAVEKRVYGAAAQEDDELEPMEVTVTVSTRSLRLECALGQILVPMEPLNNIILPVSRRAVSFVTKEVSDNG